MALPFRNSRAASGLVLSTLFGGCAAAPAPPVPPPEPIVQPRPVPSTAPAPSVYRNPKIAAVYLRAHVDAAGRLLGPQVMYQIAEPGQWNVDALDPDRAASEPPPETVHRGEPDSPLLDPDRAARIRFTGLMSPSDAVAAALRAKAAGPGTQAVFDVQAGWLLIPP